MAEKIKKLNTLVRLALCAIILLAGVGALITLKKLKKRPPKKSTDSLLKTILVKKLEKEKIQAQVTGYGTAKPVNDVELSSEIKGRIIETLPILEPGVIVEKGTLLAKIDASDYEIALKETQAEIQRLKGEKKIIEQTLRDNRLQLETVEKIFELEVLEFRRSKTLYDKNVKNQKDLNRDAQALSGKRQQLIKIKSSIAQDIERIKTVEAQLESAEAKKNKALIDLKRSVIRAPFTGRIKKVYIDNGEHVSSGEKLFEIADDRKLEISTPVDAYDASNILRLKKQAHNYGNWFSVPEKMKVIIEWVEDADKCRWEGKVSRIGAYNSETRTIDIIVDPVKQLINEKGENFPLVDGMFCKVIFQGRVLPDAVKIPWVAIQFDRDVFIIDKENKLKKIHVKVFSTEKDNVIVSSGLKPGELLVIQRLPRGQTDGMKVKPVIKKSAPGIPGEKSRR